MIAANIVVFVLLATTVSGYGYVQWRLGQVHRVTVHGLTSVGKGHQSAPVAGVSAGPPFTLLIVGSDTRALTGTDNAQFGSQAATGGQRSDSIILARVVPATTHIALLSIPRDLLVAIPGLGTARINAAFSSGSPDLLIRTIQQDLGIEVNHYVALNFDSFRQIADAIGGVEQYFPTRARDLFTNLNIPAAGCYNLTGDVALAFVRSREYQYYLNGYWHYQLYPESDLGRIERQQEFIKKAVKKAEGSGLTDPLTLNALIAGVTQNLTVDTGFSVSQMVALAGRFRHINPDGIENWTLPTVNSSAVPGALDTIKSQAAAVVQEFLAAGAVPPPTATTATTASTALTATTSATAPAQTPAHAATATTAPTTATTASNTATTPTASLNPASSSVYHGQYVPPGLVPGQVPLTCGP